MSNWGRWGKADELGTLNLIDAPAVLRGLSTVRIGRVITLSHVLGSSRSPVVEGRRAAIQHYMIRDGGDPSSNAGDDDFVFAEDYMGLPIHSTTTHIDALAHGWTKGQMYNGFPATAVNSRGALLLGIDKMAPIVTRGILVDIPRQRGLDRLPIDFAIQDTDLDAAFAELPAPLPGDAVLVRTGWVGGSARPNDIPLRHPGLDMSTAAWFHKQDIALVGADTLAAEIVPSRSGAAAPLHVSLIRDLGLPIMELLDLESLAAAGCTEFCLVVAPLRILGGTGSPVSPLAIV